MTGLNFLGQEERQERSSHLSQLKSVTFLKASITTSHPSRHPGRKGLSLFETELHEGHRWFVSVRVPLPLFYGRSILLDVGLPLLQSLFSCRKRPRGRKHSSTASTTHVTSNFPTRGVDGWRPTSLRRGGPLLRCKTSRRRDQGGPSSGNRRVTGSEVVKSSSRVVDERSARPG